MTSEEEIKNLKRLLRILLAGWHWNQDPLENKEMYELKKEIKAACK